MAKECSRVLKHGCIQTCEAVQKHRKRFELNLLEPVSYTHLTLPTILLV